jgi:hypothetical protein
MTQNLSADLERDMGQRKMGGQGSCRAESDGEWRLANDKTTAKMTKVALGLIPDNS